MKIPKGNIERICLDHATGVDSRYRLDCVKYEVENSRVIATDGHSLIRCTVDVEEGDVSCLIPSHVFWLVRRLGLSRIRTSEKSIDVVRIGNTVDVVASFTCVKGIWPNVATMDVALDAVKTPVVAFDLQVLLDSVTAMQGNIDEDEENIGYFKHIGIFVQEGDDGMKAFIVAPLDEIGGCDVKCVSLMMPIKRENMKSIEAVASRGTKVKTEAVADATDTFNEADARRVVHGEKL